MFSIDDLESRLKVSATTAWWLK